MTNTNSATTQVLIVDDHPAMRFGLRTLLDDEPGLAICGEASDAGEAIGLFRERQPGLVIVDIALNGGSGIDLIKQIHALDERVGILVLSMHDETLYAERVLHAGALGFVNKGEPNERILEAVHAVRAGRVSLSARMTQRVLQHARSPQKCDGAPTDRLTNRELDVLRLIGEGRSTREIAEHLSLAFKTVETHKETMKQKLGLRTASELACFAARWLQEH